MFSLSIKSALFSKLALIIVLAFPTTSNATTVRLLTPLGAIDVALYDSTAPRTVSNFLAYVNSGAYKNSFIHRSVPGFIIQGGGYVWDDASGNVANVPQGAPIANEFSASRSNLRGTLAMAKLGGDPNSATSQWYINLADNSANLDTTNGGYTVFGEVSAASMAVVDAIALLPLTNAGSPFDTLPIVGAIATNTILKSNLAIVSAAIAVPNNYQGLWWNANESGWGISITQHGNIGFVAMYTYDDAGQPIWYAITNCPITANGCTGDIYRINGGTAPTVPWAGAGRIPTKVGTGTFTFTDINTGSFNFTINNISKSKAITRFIFSTPGPLTLAPKMDFTDLWWNANESGWGLTLTQQSGIIFAAWYTYDTNGNPIWYAASNCPLNSAFTACESPLYRFSGGAPLSSTWPPGSPSLEAVGTVTFTFSNSTTGLMNYKVNNVTSSRAISRLVY
jgi:cyclophilin family peptidyl-prolyl cis-trans isomerase